MIMAILNESLQLELAVIIVVLSLILYLRHKIISRRFYKLAAKIPGSNGYPLIGNIFDFLGGPNEIFHRIMNKYKDHKDILKLWIGPRLLVFLYNPVDVELILSSSVHIDKSPEYRYFEPWLGNGLLISTGETWKAHRKLIAPTFHINVLKLFFHSFNKNTKDVVLRLSKVSGKEFDCHYHMTKATMDILLETVMGVDKKNHENTLDYTKAVMKLSELLHIRQVKFWLGSNLIYSQTNYRKLEKSLLNMIHMFTSKVVQFHKMSSKSTSSVDITSKDKELYTMEQADGLKDDLDSNDMDDVGEKKRYAFLELLMNNSKGLLTDKDIQSQVDTIMFEGHDTTAAASSFFMCMMAAHPIIQERVVEELVGILKDPNRDITFQDTLEMKYLERCILETLRLYPPVPFIARKIKQEIKLSSMDLVIPTDCTVVVAPYKIHRRENFYQNPTVFNPDNFLPEKSSSRHYYSFVPFSAGPRSCVGRKYAMLKLKVLLAKILINFKIVGGKDEKDWLLQADIIMKRSDGFRVTVQPRNLG